MYMYGIYIIQSWSLRYKYCTEIYSYYKFILFYDSKHKSNYNLYFYWRRHGADDLSIQMYALYCPIKHSIPHFWFIPVVNTIDQFVSYLKKIYLQIVDITSEMKAKTSWCLLYRIYSSQRSSEQSHLIFVFQKSIIYSICVLKMLTSCTVTN